MLQDDQSESGTCQYCDWDSNPKNVCHVVVMVFTFTGNLTVFRFHFVAPSPSFGKSCTTCDVQNPTKPLQIREESEKRCRILPGCFQARQDHTKTVGFTNRALVSVKIL